MTQRERRIFVYRSDHENGDEQTPEPAPESGPGPGPVRAWLFSTLGMVCAWLLAIGLMIPAGTLVLVTLRERYITLLFGFGLWLVFGLIVIHWWIPSATVRHPRTEGIAASGWHIALSLALTGGLAWLWLFRDGITPAFTLGETRPVIVAGGLVTALSGYLVLWARGHTPARTMRYAVIGSSIIAVWMALWLVAAHGGL